MMEVIVITEGQTEEAFIKQVVAPSVRHLNIFVKPQLLNTSKKAKGGSVTYDRFKFNARNTLRGKCAPIVTSFLDLYALDNNFPEFGQSKTISDVYQKVELLEQALNTAIIEHAGCRVDKFRAYIQPYEFEGLLFSECHSVVSVEGGWQCPPSRHSEGGY
jgi:hypothetical protein